MISEPGEIGSDKSVLKNNKTHAIHGKLAKMTSIQPCDEIQNDDRKPLGRQ